VTRTNGHCIIIATDEWGRTDGPRMCSPPALSRPDEIDVGLLLLIYVVAVYMYVLKK